MRKLILLAAMAATIVPTVNAGWILTHFVLMRRSNSDPPLFVRGGASPTPVAPFTQGLQA